MQEIAECIFLWCVFKQGVPGRGERGFSPENSTSAHGFLP